MGKTTHWLKWPSPHDVHKGAEFKEIGLIRRLVRGGVKEKETQVKRKSFL
jgi:hypothetical protein